MGSTELYWGLHTRARFPGLQSRAGSCAQAGNMAGFYAPNSGWLSSWGLGIGLLEQSGNPSLVVPWFDVSHLFRVVVLLPFCPAPPILITESCWRKQTASVLLTRRWPMRGLCWLHGLGLGPWPRHTAWFLAVSYTHLTLPTSLAECRSRWSPYH